MKFDPSAIRVAQDPPPFALSKDEKKALAGILTPLLGGSIFVAVLACVCFMAWNEPADSQGLSLVEKQTVTYACGALILATFTMIVLSVRAAFRGTRSPSSNSAEFNPTGQRVAA
ncbi:hypothetical protein [Stieleria varia]|uniref:Uncharacterized protein n=1 Tax=Stieleria varia TaxID=2528005 RepID=A0A5C6AUK0_9BACT|nr:hypothetical protein [Stieleria varia]TWU02692.1 hypothetical protein Pla52n_37500 [Stieleria varia]